MAKNLIDRPPTPFWKTFVYFMLGLFALLLVISFFIPGNSGDCIGRIKVTGEIVYDSADSLLGGAAANTPEDINGLLKQADSDEYVKAIFLQVNSPGGSAVASKEIYDQIRKLKKPTIVYMTEIAASGGYYISAAGDYIIAHPNALTGSIGARATFTNYEGLFEKLGLREETIKSGELKDIGAGYRNLTDKERELLQGLIDETFQIFRKDVEAGRKGKLNSALFNEALDARILSASQAKRIGLIDEVGGMDVALLKANELGGNKEINDLKLTNAQKEDKLWPVCDFSSNKGFNLFSGLSSELGKSFASGFASALGERKVSVKYN